MSRNAFWTAVAVTVSLSVLAACTQTPKQPVTPAPPAEPAPAPAPPKPPEAQEPISALELPRTSGPLVSQLPGWQQADLLPALQAFNKSCRSLQKRQDVSGLTRPEDWSEACASASTTPQTSADARRFFETRFATLRVGDGTGLNTGYYEPELAGSRTWSVEYSVPLYKRPPELVDVDLGAFRVSLRGQRIAGRVQGKSLVPYYDRGQIEDGALKNRGLELAWVKDPYEAFFLHIQGSGRIKLPDGSVMRVGYDGQNGHAYVGLGRRLLDMGLLPPGQATMQGIIAWARANPDKARDVMRENRSFIFFRELTGDGPLGAMGVALTPETSVASDPRFIPLGAPLWLQSAYPNPQNRQQQLPIAKMMVAQDTGGAIKGANRLDLFWGAGERAALIAGGLSWRGITTLLLPKQAVERLLSTPPVASPTS
ncbi:murein transglycosylase A [Pedomonas mirosovicensis]|uniref:murein transglycosylase A n=1 Tax=Pedomonas mirosovicensis TaxID=2908641 RepID=UPI00216A43A5|nr:murein transglycosylase A [Pedomonas mirosovicensis]MCH8684024.1 murein transglycosylase A [Pedomonas mirosovicensis]